MNSPFRCRKWRGELHLLRCCSYGQKLARLPSSEDLADQPTLRMFDDSPDGGRPRGFTESFASTTASCSTIFQKVLTDAILDTDSDGREGNLKDKDGKEGREGRVRSRSFTGPATDCAAKVQIRSMACEVDERYFAWCRCTMTVGQIRPVAAADYWSALCSRFEPRFLPVMAWNTWSVNGEDCRRQQAPIFAPSVPSVHASHGQESSWSRGLQPNRQGMPVP